MMRSIACFYLLLPVTLVAAGAASQRSRLHGGRIPDDKAPIVAEVEKVAKELGCSPAQVSLRWLRQRSPRAIPIVGARTLDQLRDNLGAVDVVRDYPSLLKPALFATTRGGRLLASNHAPEVTAEEWLAVLRRTGEKCGRPLGEIELLTPEDDFPSFDGAPPLKIAWIEAP